MKTLVTGAAGFIGRRLVERLTGRGDAVRAFVRPHTNTGWMDTLGVEVVRGDIGDPRAVAEAVSGCRLVFHLAARTEARGPLSNGDVQVANIQGTRNIAEAVRQAGIQRLVFASSVSVYGRSFAKHLIDEKTPPHPDSPYGKSKLFGEEMVSSLRLQGPAIVTARISTVWGAGSTSWLNFFRAIASGNFRLIGTGMNYHHIADVSDIVEGLLLCASVEGATGNTYLLSGNEPVQLRDLIRMIGCELGAPAVHSAFPAAPLHVYRALDWLARELLGRHLPKADRLALFLGDRRFDVSKARQELGYQPKISTGETVRSMVQWFRSEGHLPHHV